MNFLARSNKLVSGNSDKISGVEEAGKSAKKKACLAPCRQPMGLERK